MSIKLNYRKKSLKKPHLSFKKWGLKFSLPYLPSEQGYWRAYFWGDLNRMREDVKSQKGESPIIKKGRIIADPAFAFQILRFPSTTLFYYLSMGSIAERVFKSVMPCNAPFLLSNSDP
jgi:hypothetical protein